MAENDQFQSRRLVPQALQWNRAKLRGIKLIRVVPVFISACIFCSIAIGADIYTVTLLESRRDNSFEAECVIHEHTIQTTEFIGMSSNMTRVDIQTRAWLQPRSFQSFARNALHHRVTIDYVPDLEPIGTIISCWIQSINSTTYIMDCPYAGLQSARTRLRNEIIVISVIGFVILFFLLTGTWLAIKQKEMTIAFDVSAPMCLDIDVNLNPLRDPEKNSDQIGPPATAPPPEEFQPSAPPPPYDQS